MISSCIPGKGIINLPRYSLGGFYLAKYDDSPAGPFEEVSLLRVRPEQAQILSKSQAAFQNLVA